MPVPRTISMSRKELYDRVWAEPVERVAKALGISDVGLAKACRRHQVPVPPRGYWRRKETGQKVRPTPLPELTDSARKSATVTFYPTAVMAQPSAPEQVHPLIAFERDPVNTLVVSPSVRVGHPLIQATRRYWAAAKRGEVIYDANALPHLNIRVSPAAAPRALRLMQVLLSALDQRGFTTSATPKGQTISTVLGVPLELSLRERLRQQPHEPTAKEQADMKKWSWTTVPKFDHVDSGELELKLENTWGTRHLWRDGKRQQLEQLLNDVIEGLIGAALRTQERAAQQEREQRARAEAERRRQEAERSRREERARIRRLERLHAATERHEELERFVARLHDVVGSVAADTQLGEWLAWSRAYIERCNPLRELREHGSTLTLYHPLPRYECDRVVADGFSDRSTDADDDQDLPPGVLLGDVPLTRGYDSVCIKVTIPASAVLPYEAPHEQHSFRRFLVPASVINRYGNRSIAEI